jgi:hypothetical protein
LRIEKLAYQESTKSKYLARASKFPYGMDSFPGFELIDSKVFGDCKIL